jgi:hypothetical protein
VRVYTRQNRAGQLGAELVIEEVNEAEWNALRGVVRKPTRNVLRTFAEVETGTADNIGDAVVIIAHTAYHLGAIRQLAKNV